MHLLHEAGGLQVETASVEGDTLADVAGPVDVVIVDSVVLNGDDAGRNSGGLTDSGDEVEALAKELGLVEHADLHHVRVGAHELASNVLEELGVHNVGAVVTKLASENNGLGNSGSVVGGSSGRVDVGTSSDSELEGADLVVALLGGLLLPVLVEGVVGEDSLADSSGHDLVHRGGVLGHSGGDGLLGLLLSGSSSLAGLVALASADGDGVVDGDGNGGGGEEDGGVSDLGGLELVHDGEDNVAELLNSEESGGGGNAVDDIAEADEEDAGRGLGRVSEDGGQEAGLELAGEVVGLGESVKKSDLGVVGVEGGELGNGVEAGSELGLGHEHDGERSRRDVGGRDCGKRGRQ